MPISVKWKDGSVMWRLHDPNCRPDYRPDYRPDTSMNVYTVKLSIQPVGTTVEWTFTRPNCRSIYWPDYRPDSWMNTCRCGNQSATPPPPINESTQTIKMKSFVASFIDSIGRLGGLICIVGPTVCPTVR